MSTGIRGKWQPNPAVVATIKVSPGAPQIYWRAATYDQFLLNEWVPSQPVTKTEVAAGDPLLEGTAEDQTLEGTGEFTFTVLPMQDTGHTVLSPATPVALDHDADVTFVGTTGNLDAVERRDGGPYTVTADVRLRGEEPGQLNEAALRSAGTTYPADIRNLYLAVPDGAMPKGGAAEALYQKLRAAANTTNPYDFAAYLKAQFVKSPAQGGIFTYDTDVSDLLVGDCQDISIVECFAHYKRGFCQWYATTMAIFLREAGIPARIAEGYLPAKRSPQGEEIIKGDTRHQWVEVYFPYYGWVMFDPTGGGVSVQQPLPLGPAGASTPPLPSSAFAIPSFRDPRNREPDDAGSATTRKGVPLASFIAIALLLALIVGAVAFFVWQRGPRSGTTADHAYRTVTRIASRFGFGPRPNQTVYEYAGQLGEVLPIARPELETVAQAKVETVYGRFLLEDERVRALRDAERRLRLNLLRLAFRRRARKRSPKS
jgi:transglutaminase-like putative cysteine protease